jgi:hypothetical protein
VVRIPPPPLIEPRTVWLSRFQAQRQAYGMTRNGDGGTGAPCWRQPSARPCAARCLIGLNVFGGNDVACYCTCAVGALGHSLKVPASSIGFTTGQTLLASVRRLGENPPDDR